MPRNSQVDKVYEGIYNSLKCDKNPGKEKPMLTPSELEILKVVKKEWTEDKYESGALASKEGINHKLPFLHIKDSLCDPHDEMAIRWCAIGYIGKVSGIHSNNTAQYYHLPIIHKLNELLREYLDKNEMFHRESLLESLNDDLGHSYVISFLEWAIDKTEGIIHGTIQ